jgi:predicted dehydrogenase
VAGIDPIAWKQELAKKAGSSVFSADDQGWVRAAESTGGTGYDAVIVAAATKSSDPMVRAAGAARDRGVIVLLGDAGLDLDRRPLYEKELTVRVARSYGPGRYDPSFEVLGVDYPIGGVRWTARRNMEAVVGFMASKRLDVADLITHRFAFEDALDAYAVLDDETSPYLGIVLEYQGETGGEAASELSLPAGKSHDADRGGAGLIGAGRFARDVLLPTAQAAGFERWTVVSSSGGSSAATVGEKFGFERAVSDADQVIADPATGTVFVATRHDTHASFVTKVLEAGQHVFCEKPLAITEEELDGVIDAYQNSPGELMVGFNRRWSPAITETRELLGDGNAPVQVIYRVNAGALPDDHWLKDRRMGGRLLGEGCHFIDTCDAIIGRPPSSVFTLTSGIGELLLDDDFTVTLGYPNGSQAVIIYASTSSTVPGKERVEILGSGRSIIIDDYATLLTYGPSGTAKRRYRPADKGHRRELVVFAELVHGSRDGADIAENAFVTSRVSLAAVRSAMTGQVVSLST